MAKKEYDWHIGEKPPKIEVHSQTKHRVYEEYLIHYIQVLNSNPRIPTFRLTLIDGFAGGGVYCNPQDNSLYPGSPFRLIKAAEAAAAAINVKRQQEGVRLPFELQAEYFFIEKKKSNHEYLNWYLSEQGLGPRFNNDIFSLRGEFTGQLDRIIKHITNSGGNRRCIFLLDQYGYGEVPFDDVRTIFSKLPNAEIILTFATDWLIDYMSNTPEYLKTLQRIGIDQVLDIDSLLEEKNDNKDWRQLVQFELHRVIKSQSGAKHYTPFFIVSKEANRSFWLVHLSNHPRARDVMTQLHWRLKNHFAHYGGPGIRMFGYDPAKDEQVTGLADLFGETEYSFDETARNRTLQGIVVELPELIYQYTNGIRFSELYRLVANTTPATSQHIKEAATLLSEAKELEILGPNGERRRKSSRVTDEDVLQIPRQKVFELGRSDLLDLKNRKD